ncbi:MAG: hypothetical protein RIS56_1141 [Verrucomicrobiota bacterium]
MNPPPVNSSVGPYRDRRTALLIAGVLEILLGVGAWLMVGLMVFAASMVTAQGAGSKGSIIPGIAVYGIAGLVFVILGGRLNPGPPLGSGPLVGRVLVLAH